MLLTKFDTDLRISSHEKGLVTEVVEKNDKERSIVHYFSTNAPDRGGDVVNQYGMDTSDYDKSKKTVLFNHDANAPIARNAWYKADDKGVLGKTIFSSTAFADDIYKLHLEDILGNWSIGFRIGKNEDGTFAAKYDSNSDLFYIDKWKIHEYSSVSVAMNAECVDVAKGLVKSLAGQQFVMGEEAKVKALVAIEEYQREISDLRNSIEEYKKYTEKFENFNAEEFKKEILLDIDKIKADIFLQVSTEIVAKKQLEDRKALILGGAIQEAIKSVIK